MSNLPIVTPAGEGDALQFSPTELLRWKATQATTGAFDQFELTAQPDHAGAPLHVHATVEECFYVLAGAFRFAVAGSEVLAEPGSFLFVPRGTAHTWTNAAETPSTMLLTFVPGGMKPFFDEAAPVMHAHPLDVDARIQRALDRVRPYLGSHAGGVEYLGVTDGVARLRLEGSCHGCPSSTVTVQLAITGAVEEAAPEVTQVVVEGMTEPPGPELLQIGRRPVGPASASDDPAAMEGRSGPDGGREVGWVTLPDIGPPSSRPVAASPATSRSGSDCRIRRNPVRTSSWSSAISTWIKA